MTEPESYHKAHKDAKAVAGQIIREYFSKVQWRINGGDILMDVGTGPGDVLMDYIYPMVPQNFQKIICADISSEMLEYAKSYYGNRNKFEYRVFDIESQAGVPNDLKGTVDYLTCIFVLHWVNDIEAAVKNLYDLLRPNGGQCLAIFMSSNSVFEAFNYLSNTEKWREYRTNLQQIIPFLFHSKNPVEEFRTTLSKGGFDEINVDSYNKTYSYRNFEVFREGIKAVAGLTEKELTPTLLAEYLDDLVAAVQQFASLSKNFHEMNSDYCISNNVIVAIAKRLK